MTDCCEVERYDVLTIIKRIIIIIIINFLLLIINQFKCKFMRRSKSKQSLGVAVLSKTSASSVTGETPGKYVQSHVDGDWRGRFIQRRGPAAVNERSPRLVQSSKC